MYRRFLFFAFLIGTLLTSTSFGQVGRGSFVGTVTDSTGAVIPGVTLTVTNTGTNQERQVITNEQGNYEIPLLAIGTYRLRAELPGFKSDVRDSQNLSVGDRLRIDFKLVIGDVSERVEVNSEAPLVKTEDAAMSAVMDQRKMVDLPLNGRDFTQLAYLIPGAFAPREGSSLGFRGGFTVAGQNENTNQIMLDGVNDQGGGTHELSTPLIVDAIAEFRIQTNTYGAQYGTFAGAQVDAVSKSGTNDIHGDVFFFHRNDNLDARNAFDPWPVTQLPEFRRHQYGGTFGGPIIKNRSFFFYGFQGQRQVQNLTATGTLPRAEFWNGDFSALLSGAKPVQLKDPLTGLPFAGNIIPQSRLNARSLKFHEFVPDPNLPGVTQNAVNNAIDNFDNRNQHAARVDFQINPSQSVAASYNLYRSHFIEWDQAGRPFLANTRSFDSEQRAQHLALSHTWLLGSRVVNDVRGGFNRLTRIRLPIKYGDRWFNDEIGIYGTLADRFPIFRGIPDVTFAGYEALGSPGTQLNYNTAYTFTDTLSFTLGNHNLKAGFLYYKKGQNTLFGSTRRGSFAFSGAFSGDSFADFVLGFPATTTRVIPGPCERCGIDFHQWIPSYDLFVQDDWKFSSRLTLNLGVRWEYNVALREKYGRMLTYDLAINEVRPGLADSPLHNRDLNNFAPRVGLAYRLTDKTVLRSGFGVFYSVDDLCNCSLYTNNPPNFYTQTFNSLPTNIVATMDNPFPVAPEVQFQTRAGLSVYGVDQDFRDMYYENWNLSLQHELPANMVIEAAYEGKVAHGLPRTVNINQARPGTGSVQSRRPVSPWGDIFITETTANSNYHGGVLKVEKRMSNGLSVLTSYTFSKMIDDGEDSNGGNASGAQDELNRRAERGLSGFDTRHRFALSTVYELPFGAGHRWGGGMQNPAVRQIISGWQLSGITSARSGLPFTPVVSGDLSGTGQRKDRPNLIGDPVLPASERTANRWFRTEAFALPAAGQFGNAGRSILTGPGARNVDLSLIKTSRLGENRTLQLRFEFFNAFNTPSYQLPNGTVNSSNFGRIFTASAARQIQLGSKLVF